MSPEVKDEISEMLNSLTAISTGEPSPEPEPEAPPESEKEEVKEEVEEAETTTEEKVEEPEEVVEEVKAAEPEKEEPAPEPVADERDKTITELRAQVEELKAAKKEPEKKEPPKIEDQDFIGDLDIDDLTRDPKEFNKVLNKIYQKATVDARTSMMSELPDIVKENITIVEQLRQTSETFYNENPDLKPFRKVVGTVFDELVAANPDRTYSDVIKEVGPEVRKRLDLKVATKEDKADKPEPKKAPNLPQKGGRSGRSQGKTQTNPLQDELEEMTRTLGR